MRKTTFILAVLLCGVLLTTGCKKKKETDDIITKKVEKVVKKQGTQKMSDFTWSKTVEWQGKEYSLFIERKADESLPKCKDEQDNEYYDNKITVKVIGKGGAKFFEHVFTKNDFAAYTNESYGKKGALLGIAFDRIEDSNIIFGAGVGSPDSMSDEFVPLSIIISSNGSMTIKKDTQMDIRNDNPEIPEKKPMDEIEAAEAEGM